MQIDIKVHRVFYEKDFNISPPVVYAALIHHYLFCYSPWIQLGQISEPLDEDDNNRIKNNPRSIYRVDEQTSRDGEGVRNRAQATPHNVGHILVFLHICSP